MGEPNPPIWPIIEDDKFYHCVMDAYGGIAPPHGCEAWYMGEMHCCQPGFWINNFINTDSECHSPVELCMCTGSTAQRIKSLIGPFDTLGECVADL